MQMSQHEFKEMCRQLKIFPVVVSEETVDKVTLFCAAKRNGPNAVGMVKQKSEDNAGGGAANHDYATNTASGSATD